MNLKLMFSLLFLNIDISVTLYTTTDLNFSVPLPDVLKGGRVSQIFHFGLKLYFMSKNG